MGSKAAPFLNRDTTLLTAPRLLRTAAGAKDKMMEKGARIVYQAAVWLFLVGVVTQVFLAGMVVVAAQLGWNPHRGLGHTLAVPLLLLLISMYPGHLPGALK